MPHCSNCGAFVTAAYHRVYSDNEGSLVACPECCDSFEQAIYTAQGRDRRQTYMHGRYRR